MYSASPLAAAEFPQFDVNLRSAVSIARRLQDPLAELVKIDPKAVGVGQYQHDMPQKRLNETLDGVVEDCVNQVGVDLNTASAPLLERVAGVSAAVAKNIVARREAEGPFESRPQLKKVKGLGPKAYQQCAGFLRLPDAAEPLDGTAVHPESYPAARRLLELCGFTEQDIGTETIQELPRRMKAIGMEKLCQETGAGAPTLRDIRAELLRPGRDVRDSLPAPAAAQQGAGTGRPDRGHGADRHCAQCDRLRRLCGHRRASGWPGARESAVRQVHPAPRRRGEGGRCGQGEGAERGREKAPHWPDHAGREAELTRPEFLENRRKNARVCPGGRDPGRKAHPRVGVFKHFEKEL